MWLKTERVADVVLLVPGRPLIGGPDIEQLESALDDLIDAGQRKVLIDLENVQILSSLAMQGLRRLQNRATRRGMAFVLCNAQRILQEPAQFWIGQVFTLHESREAALQDLVRVRPAPEVPRS